MELNDVPVEGAVFWELEDPEEATSVIMDKDDLIEVYTLIQAKLKEIGVLAK